MGLNLDLVQMIGAPKEAQCPHCNENITTAFQFCDYDIEGANSNPEPGQWNLEMYCCECENCFTVKVTISTKIEINKFIK